MDVWPEHGLKLSVCTSDVSNTEDALLPEVYHQRWDKQHHRSSEDSVTGYVRCVASKEDGGYGCARIGAG